MNFLQCTLTEIRRRPAKYIIFAVTFSVIFVALILGLNMRATITQVKDQTIAIIGPYYELSSQNEIDGPIDNELISEISGLDYVAGVNRGKAEYAIAGNFQTVKDYEGDTPDSDPSLYADVIGMTQNSVVLDANLNCALIDDFRLGDSVLLSGQFPTETEPGVLVEHRLMEQNGFKLGDTLFLEYVNGKSVAAAIVGIYETKGSFEITGSNSVGEGVFTWSPYNRVYASLDIAEQLYDWHTEQMPISIYAASVLAMQKVEREMKALPLNWNMYDFVNMTETEYKYDRLASQIEEISSYASWIMVIAIVIGIVLVTLILNLFLQYYIKDAGVLIALGSSKMRTVFQHLTSAGMISTFATLIATMLSGALSDQLIGKIVQDTTINWAVMSSFENGLQHTVSIVPQVMNVEEWAVFICGIVLLLIVSTIPLIWKLTRYHPRSILAG